MSHSQLFEPLTIRGVTLRNRIGVSPMCQYSAREGLPNAWHSVHLGSRAVGGAGLVMTEATAVSPEGRISPYDTGIWNDEQVSAWLPIARFISEQGAIPGIQLAHAGWKASTDAPWAGGKAVTPGNGGWEPLGVGNEPFEEGYPTPRQIDGMDITRLVTSWRDAALRAIRAGFRCIEIHAAHGYLFHSFLSPLSNRRTDQYGGSFDNRAQLLLRVVQELRKAIPEATPLFVRLSCSDWTPGGWTSEDSVRLASLLRNLGVDVIDCSSGGAVPRAVIPTGPGYQTPFAAAIRDQCGIATAAVGLISEAHQAETIVRTGQADLVLIGRAMLRNPSWALTAAKELRVDTGTIAPKQYGRAW